MGKILEIRWQRLVDEHGRTCERCGATETAVVDAVGKLRRALSPLGIDVDLEKESLAPAEFRDAPLESNRIWIAGKPIEAWLSASTGQSQCCSTCGDADCRTLTVDGTTYEAIPVDLIVRAGLLAGARLLTAEPAACCAPADPAQKNAACCSPPGKV